MEHTTGGGSGTEQPILKRDKCMGRASVHKIPNFNSKNFSTAKRSLYVEIL